jgi:RimJ/RimL family protein N-acetyltransferase
MSLYGSPMPHPYPPLNLEVRTPRLVLRGATDDLLDALIPIVRAGVADTEPWPFDDPMSLYDDNPRREWRWLRGIWAGRASVSDDFWRLYFVVVVNDVVVGIQDLIGVDFAAFGTVSTFSWLQPSARGSRLGSEMRAAILHLAFEGLGAREAKSEAFTDNRGSNGVSRALGYEPNGTTWASRRGTAAPMNVWRLTTERWQANRRDDIELAGVEACLPVLGL